MSYLVVWGQFERSSGRNSEMMKWSGPSVTVVILAWNAWDYTQRCLDSLLLTLKSGDQVVVVDNGSTDATGEGLKKYQSVEVLRNSANLGFAAGCNQGAAVANGEVIVFLNNDTIVFDGWLDGLLTPFSDPKVGAVGPMSDNASGPQQILETPYDPQDPLSISAFAQAWQRTHSGQTSDCARLAGFCIAVRTDSFNNAGGFDEQYELGGFEDDDLCMTLRNQGMRLLIAHGSFVHHVAHVTFDSNQVDWHNQQSKNLEKFRAKWGTDRIPPLRLLSVCLIVKDEEQVLESCLETVIDIADEIIVYDTGSSDRTIEIAEAAGARVIEGYWDDSFARARNAALAEASGEWVLSLDADEKFFADPETLRTLLSDRRSKLDGYLVPIENLHGAGNARSVHTAIRLFRRTSCEWRHRLHEQVVAADDPGRQLVVGYLSGARIIHSGYAAIVFDSKNKAERNLTLAEAALDDEDISRGYALMNYGRALESVGRSHEAVDALKKAASLTDDSITQRLAVNNLIYILGRLGRFDEALDQVRELRRISVSQIAADIAEGHMRISMGDAEAGLSMLKRVPLRGRSDDGMEYGVHMLSAIRGEALASLGGFGEAADVVLEAIHSDGVLEADLGELISWLAKANRPLSEIARVLDISDLMPVLGRVLRLSPDVADTILEGIWERFPDRLEPLAAAGRLGPKLPIARALLWSSRLRNVGLTPACPLVAIANNTDMDPINRILAGAAAFGSFGERGVINAVHEARSRLDALALAETTEVIGRLAPGLLEASHVDAAPLDVGTLSSISGLIDHGRPTLLETLLPKVAAIARRGGVNVVAPFEKSTFYGSVARSIADALCNNGISVSTTSYHADGRKGTVRWDHSDDGDFPYDTTLIILSPEDMTNYVFDNGAASFEGRYVVGVWLWDFGQPADAMRTAALMVHEIWVPTAFAGNAVAQVTDRTVKRIPLPVVDRQIDGSNGLGETEFTFLASVDYSLGFERQNPLGTVEAFCAAFQPGEGPKLVIETLKSANYAEDNLKMKAAVAHRSDISFLEDPPGGMGSFLNNRTPERSCLVSLHKSEGTGLVIARAMVFGIPTIVTDHSFSAELQGRGDSFQVPYVSRPIPEDEYRCARGGRWAEPDLGKAAEAMRLVVSQPLLAAAKAKRASERGRRQFSVARSVQVMRDRFIAIDRLRYGDSPLSSADRYSSTLVSG